MHADHRAKITERQRPDPVPILLAKWEADLCHQRRIEYVGTSSRAIDASAHHPLGEPMREEAPSQLLELPGSTLDDDERRSEPPGKRTTGDQADPGVPLVVGDHRDDEKCPGSPSQLDYPTIADEIVGAAQRLDDLWNADGANAATEHRATGAEQPCGSVTRKALV